MKRMMMISALAMSMFMASSNVSAQPRNNNRDRKPKMEHRDSRDRRDFVAPKHKAAPKPNPRPVHDRCYAPARPKRHHAPVPPRHHSHCHHSSSGEVAAGVVAGTILGCILGAVAN